MCFLIVVVLHFSFFSVANEDISCSGVFVSNLLTLKFDLREIGVLLLVLLCIQLHNQAVYTPVRITHELFVSLLPIWIMLYVFQPVKRSVSSDQQVLISATQSSVNSYYNTRLQFITCVTFSRKVHYLIHPFYHQAHRFVRCADGVLFHTVPAALCCPMLCHTVDLFELSVVRGKGIAENLLVKKLFNQLILSERKFKGKNFCIRYEAK